MAIDYSQLTKIQKIAAFFIFIGADAAAEVMKEFDTAQLELICREMANLHVIEEPVQKELIGEFGQLILTGVRSKLGGVGYAQSALAKAKGDFTAATILNRVAPSTIPSEAGEDIRQMDGRQILNLVKAEQPQTVAFILSYLDTAKAAEIVMMLAPELREEVVERLGAMEPTSHDVLLKIAKNLNRHFDKKSLKQGLHHSGGVKSVADILNALDKDTRKTLMTRIEERNAPLGAAIRKKVFSFEDLARLERVDLQRVMREVDMGDLAVALKPAKPSLIAAVMASISKRAAEGLKEDIEMLGPVKMKDVEAAQDKIIQVVRKLEEAEEITLDSGGDDRAFV
ncbi:MAG: flagellar motor switch protein FliG [Chthoniobacteraceae bacterium]|nr:flagellar motor switch protein FliG [Chthoniobacteraceae bacterium]